jgi:hypothetical protein
LKGDDGAVADRGFQRLAIRPQQLLHVLGEHLPLRGQGFDLEVEITGAS